MIWALLLAAGESRRMGEFKQLLEFAGKTFVETCVDNLLASRIDRIIVVTGYRDRDVRSVLASRPVDFVHNPEYASGMSFSVKKGIRTIPGDASAVLIALADQPQIKSSTINRIIEAYLLHRPLIVLPVFGERRGHPVIFDLSLRSEILSFDPARGLRQVVHAHQDSTLRLNLEDETVIHDFDFPEDYSRYRQE